MQDLNNIDKALPPSYQAHMLVFAKLLAFVVFLLSLPVTTLPLHYTVIFLMLFGFGVWDVGNTLAVADGSPADRWHIFTGQDIFENESVRTALNTGSKMRSWWSNKLSNNLSQESQRSLFMFGYKDKTGLMFPSIVVVGLALITKLIVSTPVVLLFTPLVSVVVAYPFVQHSLLLCGLLLLLVGYTKTIKVRIELDPTVEPSINEVRLSFESWVRRTGDVAILHRVSTPAELPEECPDQISTLQKLQTSFQEKRSVVDGVVGVVDGVKALFPSSETAKKDMVEATSTATKSVIEKTVDWDNMIRFPGPIRPGRYEAHFIRQGAVLTKSAQFDVPVVEFTFPLNGEDSVQQAQPTCMVVGSDLTVRFTPRKSHSKDWIGLFLKDETNMKKYKINKDVPKEQKEQKEQIDSNSSSSSGSEAAVEDAKVADEGVDNKEDDVEEDASPVQMTFTLPMEEGEYVFRYFCNGAYTCYGQSASIKVESLMMDSPVKCYSGDSIEINCHVMDNRNRAGDWVGLYPIDGTPHIAYKKVPNDEKWDGNLKFDGTDAPVKAGDYVSNIILQRRGF